MELLNSLTTKVDSITSRLNTPAGNGVEGMLNGQQAPYYVKAVSQSKPFSFGRFCKATQFDREEIAPHEIGILNQYKKALQDTGCGLNEGGGNTLVGHWLPVNFTDYGGRLTSTAAAETAYKEVKAVFQASRPGYDPEEAAWLIKKGYVVGDADRVVKAQSAFDDALGGTLVAPPVQGPPIPIVRPQAACLAAGAQALTLPPNGRFVRPRITGVPSVKAVGESQTTPTSNLATGQMILQAKKIAGAVTMTEEATAYTSGTMDAIAQAELGRSLGLKLDYFAFYGDGGPQFPSGLTSSEYSGTGGVINISTYTFPGGGVPRGIGANGNTLRPEYGDIFPALVAERSFNIDAAGGAWVMRPMVYASTAAVRTDAVTPNDGNGVLVDILRRFGEPPSQSMWRGRRVVQTTNIDDTGTKNTGTGLTDVFFGIWQYMYFASYGAIQFMTGNNGTTFLNGQYLLRGTMYGDIGLEYPGAFLWYPSVAPLTNPW
jgi:HK97 family phage major capsid protein